MNWIKQQKSMEPVARITINFQEIFKERQKDEEDRDVENELSLQELAEGSDLEDTKDLSINPLIVPPLSLIKIQPNASAQAQLSNISKLIKSQQSTIKKIEHADSSIITAKLYQQKSSVCSKNHKCQPKTDNSKTEECLKQQKAQGKMEKKDGRKLLSSLSTSGVHDRLYNISKSHHLKQMYLPSTPDKQKSQRKSLSSAKSSKYLKNYVPFEKRVEEYISKSQLIANQQTMKKKSENQFQPRLIPSKYSDKVQSRYNKNEIRQLKASQIAQFLNSSVSSSISSLSRSAEILQRLQDHFINKIKLIFMKNSHEEIQVNEETIGLLTDVEFHILQPFIMQIEQSHLKGSHFENRFREFYNSLNLGEKMQLRHHETKTRGKYREIRREVQQRKKTPKKIEVKVDKPIKKEAVYKGNYHSVIQNFI